MYYYSFNLVVIEIFKSCGKDTDKVHVTVVSLSYVIILPQSFLLCMVRGPCVSLSSLVIVTRWRPVDVGAGLDETVFDVQMKYFSEQQRAKNS